MKRTDVLTNLEYDCVSIIVETTFSLHHIAVILFFTIHKKFFDTSALHF